MYQNRTYRNGNAKIESRRRLHRYKFKKKLTDHHKERQLNVNLSRETCIIVSNVYSFKPNIREKSNNKAGKT